MSRVVAPDLRGHGQSDAPFTQYTMPELVGDLQYHYGNPQLSRQVAWVSHIPTVLLRPLWKYGPRWNAEIHVMKRMMLNNMRNRVTG